MIKKLFKNFFDKTKWRKRRYLLIYAPFAICFILSIGLVAAIYKWPLVNASYTPEEVENDAGQDAPVSAQAEYCYYFDYSPSMQGFIEVNNNMSNLADIFKALNESNSQKRFYLMSEQAQNVDEDVFYERLKDSQALTDLYHNKIAREEIVSAADFDLSRVFSERSDDGERFSANQEVVSVIVTDFSFARDDSGKSNDDIVNRLQEYLETLAPQTNLCVYNIHSPYRGEDSDNVERFVEIETDNERAEALNNSAEIENKNDACFLVMIMTENDKAFDNYIARLENLYGDYNIDYSEKMILKNDLLNGAHTFQADNQAFRYDSELNNFNRDNDTLEKRPPNVLGVRLVQNDQGTASLNIPITEIKMDMQENDEIGESEVETAIRIKYPDIWSYSEYTENDLVLRQSAVVKEYNGAPYLYLNLEINSNIKVPHGFINKSYFIMDVQFFVKEPWYAAPDWFSGNNAGQGYEDDNERLNELLQMVTEAKINSYEEVVNNYNKYIGSLVLYVNY